MLGKEDLIKLKNLPRNVKELIDNLITKTNQQTNDIINNNSEIENIKTKLDIIEREDISVTNPVVDNNLILTTDKRQKTTMVNNTHVILPVVDKFTEIHLFFTTTDALAIILPKIKWQNE